MIYQIWNEFFKKKIVKNFQTMYSKTTLNKHFSPKIKQYNRFRFFVNFCVSFLKSLNILLFKTLFRVEKQNSRNSVHCTENARCTEKMHGKWLKQVGNTEYISFSNKISALKRDFQQNSVFKLFKNIK